MIRYFLLRPRQVICPQGSRLLLFLCLAVTALAQSNNASNNASNNPSNNASSNGSGNTAASRTQTLQQSQSNSVALFANGNATQAETTLEAVNLSKPGTGDWFFESARRLVEAALDFQVHKDYGNAQQVAQRAFTNLNQADAKFAAAGDAKSRAQVRRQTAFIYEAILGDSKTALIYYQQAQQLSPSAQSANDAARLGTVAADKATKVHH
jgi:hypothetical protein